MTIIASVSIPQAFGTRNEKQVSLIDGSMATYSASSFAVSGLAATDNFILTGSATLVVRVTRLALSGFCTSGGDINVNVVKRSNANTGGTLSSAVGQSHDSINAAATTFAQWYTAAATSLGLSTGTPVRSALLFLPVSGNIPEQLEWNFGNGPKQAIVLRGVAQSLCVNLAAAPAGTFVNYDIEWTESTI
jgi:hypothetical protein